MVGLACAQLVRQWAPDNRAWLPALLWVLGVACVVPLLSLAANLPQLLGLHGGQQIFQAACAACHGPGGEGTPQYIAGFEQPDSFPHFNKCDESEDEYTRDWTEIIRDGGPARGFSQIMPAFGSVLTPEQINELVRYLRSLCTDHSWPPGELNVPRALITDKAFPENEVILTSGINARGAPGISNELELEKTLGSTNELDIIMPFSWVQQPSGNLSGGVGDLITGVSHVLLSHLDSNPGPLYEATGSILAVQGQITWATGNVGKGLGAGETQLGAFAAYDQVFPAQSFLQVQVGGEQPLHTYNLASSLYLNAAFGKSFEQGTGFGRQWSPMVEVTANRSLASGAVTEWDLLPEFQVTLNTRQHVRADIGYLVPINDTAARPRQIMFYVNWDFADGGLLEGW